MAINSISSLIPAAVPAKPAVRSSEATSTEHEVTTSPPVDLASVVSEAAPSRQQVDQAMEKMRVALPQVARNLQFSIDETTGQSIVKVVDSVTKEVIRQMPSAELLAIADALDKFKGLLLKQKA